MPRKREKPLGGDPTTTYYQCGYDALSSPHRYNNKNNIEYYHSIAFVWRVRGASSKLAIVYVHMKVETI